MKKFLCLMLLAAVAMIVTPATLSATAINGSVGFTGLYTQNGGTSGQLNTATSMSITSVLVLSSTGDLTGATAPLTFASPVGVNGNAPSLVGSQLWSVTVGTDVYTFTVGTETQTLTSASQINLAGTGTLYRNGGDATGGAWQLGFGNNGASFTWQSTTASTPEPASMLLIGTGLTGLLAGWRKKK